MKLPKLKLTGASKKTHGAHVAKVKTPRVKTNRRVPRISIAKRGKRY